MSVAVLVRHGGQDALEVRDDWPVPVAGDDEVLVRVTAAAVNNTDVWTRQGPYGLPGRPDALVGRRVLVDPAVHRDGSASAPPVGLLGSEADGGFARCVRVPAAQAHDVTGSPLSDEELACLPVSYGTARGMLERAGDC